MRLADALATELADEARLETALAAAEALATRAAGVALALADIGIDLPPPAESDPALLRAVATLYLAAELDAAGVIAAAEALASLNGASGVPFPLGTAGPLVAAFWRGRQDRPTAAERAAIFTRLFGQDAGADAADHPGNIEFLLGMIELAEALYKLDEQAGDSATGGVAAQLRARRAAAALSTNIVAAAGGLTVFVAEELVAVLRQAVGIFRDPALRAALRARDTWGAVDAVLALARQPTRRSALYARRAQAGMTMLAWLAEAAPHLARPAGPLVALDHPVIAAAVEWLEVSLALGEAGADASAAATRSPWAAFA